MLDPAKLVARQPVLVTQRVTEAFFLRVVAEDRPISSLTIVSPWVSAWDTGKVAFQRLCQQISIRPIRTLLITRPPDEAWHRDALDRLAHAGVTIALLPDLHAKVFVCEAIPVGFGLVGSANLTRRSLRNFEVGVMFDGRGVLSPLLKELKWFASNDLRRLASTKYRPSRMGDS